MAPSSAFVNKCKSFGEDVNPQDCRIIFNISSGNVLNYSSIAPGTFEGDPDIAGAGVFRSFTTLSVIVAAMGLILAVLRVVSWCFFTKSSAHRYRAAMNISKITHTLLDTFIVSSADTQFLLILAVGAAFHSTEQCKLSLYHYLVLYHIVCIGLWTTILACVLARSPFKSPVSSLIRLIILVVCAVTLHLSNSLGRQPLLGNNAIKLKKEIRDIYFQTRIPGLRQRDSLLILPAFCALLPSVDPLSKLSEAQKSKFTNTGMNRELFGQTIPMLVAVSLLLTFFIVGALYKKCRWGDTYRKSSPDEKVQDLIAKRRCWSPLPIIKFIVWVILLSLIIYNWAVIGALRRWVDQSVWLKREEGANPESSFRGIGQVAPLAAIGVIGFAFCDGVWELVVRCWPKWEAGDYGDEFGS